jgi:hypothetical protein
MSPKAYVPILHRCAKTCGQEKIINPQKFYSILSSQQDRRQVDEVPENLGFREPSPFDPTSQKAMINQIKSKLSLSGMMLALLSAGNSAMADNPPSFTLKFAPGIACDFELQVEGWGGNRRMAEYKDEKGNRVRLLEAGAGTALRFTNIANNQTFSTDSTGALSQIRYNLNGSFTETDTGQSLLILYPAAQPTGPSTRLISGSIVFTVDSRGLFYMQEIKGKTTDICAAFS